MAYEATREAAMAAFARSWRRESYLQPVQVRLVQKMQVDSISAAQRCWFRLVEGMEGDPAGDTYGWVAAKYLKRVECPKRKAEEP